MKEEMKESIQSLPESLRIPLKAFVEEIQGHLQFFAKIDLNGIQSAEELELLRKKIEGRFHLIRGGSGFFKLDALRSLATKGEEQFKEVKLDELRTRALIGGFLAEAEREIDAVYKELQEIV
jgi:chemotaxis protein histidine kinase CheA